MTGTGTAGDPFLADGLSHRRQRHGRRGDTLQIKPTRGAVSAHAACWSQIPRAIAAAAPIDAPAGAVITGNGRSAAGEVVNAYEPGAADPGDDHFH